MLGDWEDEGWEGYACSFAEWTACVASGCTGPARTACEKCTAKRGDARKAITCKFAADGGRWQAQFLFPAGGIFPVVEQFAVPPNTAILGAADPNANTAGDKARQQTNVNGQTWFIVPKSVTLCGGDPMCKDRGAKGKTACVGDPKTHRQGFLMSSNSTLRNLNFQGADLGRAGNEGTLCGPGAIELPGCLAGSGCATWDANKTNGLGVVENVVVQNVRLSDAGKRADIRQMRGNCKNGEALDGAGQHVRAHQISVWVAKLPASEKRRCGANVSPLFLAAAPKHFT